VTNASAKKRELFYHGVGLPTSQIVVDFDLQGADALAEFPANPAPLNAVTDNILHHCPSGPAMFWLGVAVRS
jgi:hypothetical protein